MKVFYWFMAILIVGTFVPSAVYLVLYGITGEHEYGRRASTLWNFTRVLTLAGANILIWGHVLVALWQLAFN